MDLQNENNALNLIDYLQVFAKRRNIIVKITLFALLLSLIVSLMLPEKYTACALVLPTQQDQGGMTALVGQLGGLATLAGTSLTKGTSSDIYAGILESEAVRDLIIDRFKLADVYRKKYRQDVHKKLKDSAIVEVAKKSGIVSIRVEDEDPQRATDLANAFVDELGRISVSMSVNGAAQNRKFLEERLAQVKVDLIHAEEAVKSFSQRNKTIQVNEQAKASIEGISQLKARLTAQEVQLATLRTYLTDSSQEVINTKSAIKSLQNQLSRLEGEGGGSIPSVGSLPSLGQEYGRLMREFKMQETLLELLTKQYEMAKLGEAKDFPMIQVLQKARVPDKKSWPKRSQIVVGTTVGCFFASLLLAYILEYLQRLPQAERSQMSSLLRQLLSWKSS